MRTEIRIVDKFNNANAQRELEAPPQSAVSPKTAARKAAATKTAVSKTAVAEPAAHKIRKQNSKIPTICTLNEDAGDSSSEDIYQPSVDTQQPARGSNNPKRQKPVRENEYYDPPCNRCERVNRPCFKWGGAGACYGCVNSKRRCKYSRGGAYNEESDSEDRDGKEKKAKAKAKARKSRKTKESIEDTDEDGLDHLGSPFETGSSSGAT